VSRLQVRVTRPLERTRFWLARMASASSSHPEISVILPTFNEKDNLPLITYLIDKHLTEACVGNVANALSSARLDAHASQWDRL
jgi:hypothetical protein